MRGFKAEEEKTVALYRQEQIQVVAAKVQQLTQSVTLI